MVFNLIKSVKFQSHTEGPNMAGVAPSTWEVNFVQKNSPFLCKPGILISSPPAKAGQEECVREEAFHYFQSATQELLTLGCLFQALDLAGEESSSIMEDWLYSVDGHSFPFWPARVVKPDLSAGTSTRLCFCCLLPQCGSTLFSF